MLKIDKVTKYYKQIPGIIDLNLEVDDGIIFGFIGPNGSGKSTTIRSILDYIKTQSGTILVNKETNKMKNIKNIIGYLPGEVKLYDDLTVLEMIKYNDKFYQNKYLNNGLKICKYLELDTTRKIEDLSLGNLKKIGIVLALMHKPKFIILDEPTSGLDPLIQIKFFELLKEEKKKGNTIFFSSHVLSEVKQICDKVGIVKQNKLIKVMDIKELQDTNNYKVELYTKDIKEIENKLKIKIINNTFTYQEDINKLIKLLSNYKIDKISITEEDIESIFIKYYEVQND